jgi:hypothetical protein
MKPGDGLLKTAAATGDGMKIPQQPISDSPEGALDCSNGTEPKISRTSSMNDDGGGGGDDESDV